MFFVLFCLFVFCFFCFFRAAFVAYGSSQARGQIAAAATGQSHSNARSELHLQTTPLPRPAQQDGAEERVLQNLRKKITKQQDKNIKTQRERERVKVRTRGNQGHRDQEPCLQKPHSYYSVS